MIRNYLIKLHNSTNIAGSSEGFLNSITKFVTNNYHQKFSWAARKRILKHHLIVDLNCYVGRLLYASDIWFRKYPRLISQLMRKVKFKIKCLPSKTRFILWWKWYWLLNQRECENLCKGQAQNQFITDIEEFKKVIHKKGSYECFYNPFLAEKIEREGLKVYIVNDLYQNRSFFSLEEEIYLKKLKEFKLKQNGGLCARSNYIE